VKYNICEVFYSVQGEGFLQGIPMVFVRLSGCNLGCSFCDTKYALEKGREQDINGLSKLIGQYNCNRVCITGGEPFMQSLLPLAGYLKEKKYWVAAETNGTLWQKLPLDWLTVSPKKDGMRLFPKGYDERFLAAASEFKYVITGPDDMVFIERNIKKPVILQPVDNNMDVAHLIARFIKANPRMNWYLRFQNHKIAGLK